MLCYDLSVMQQLMLNFLTLWELHLDLEIVIAVGVICSFIAFVSAHDYFYPFTIFNKTSFG